MVTIFSFSCFLTFFLFISLGLIIFIKCYNERINIIWFLASLSIGLWSLGLGIIPQCQNHETALFYLKYVHYFGALFIPSFYFHFTTVLLDQEKKYRKLVLLCYVLSLLLQIANFTGTLASVVPVFQFNYYTKAELFYFAFVAYYFTIVPFIFILFFNGFNKAIENRRTQLKYMLLATLIGFCGGSTAFFPVFSIPIFPFGMFFTFLFPIIMAYAILKHKLLNIIIVIRKTIIYSLIISMLFVFSVALLFLLGSLFSVIFPYKTIWFALVIVIFLALVFQPIYRLCTSFIDRLFFRNTLPKLAEELEKSEKLAALGVFASGLAHDIKNPLTPIKTYIQDLPNKMNDPAYIEKITRIIPEQVDKITELINQLRDYAVPPVLHLTRVNAHDVIDKVLSFLEETLRGSNITVKREYNKENSLTFISPSPRLRKNRGEGWGEGLQISADPDQLEKVFLNLFINAKEAMPKGGTLTISTEPAPDNKLLITISDTGTGITPEDLPHIFEAFYTKGKKKGMGLGLTVVQRIIKEHGGRIEVSSPGEPNKTGAEFSIFL